MAYRKILVPLDGREPDRRVLEVAFAAARPFGAHLEVLHVRPDPRDMIPYMTGGMSASMMDMITAEAEAQAAAQAKSARGRFDAFCAGQDVTMVDKPPAAGGVSVAWVEETGRASEALVRRGRVSDLVVAARPLEESPPPEALEVALLDCRRPLLVAPPKPGPSLGRKLVVGWNGSAEAAGAVAAAMPFLAAADSVDVIKVVEEASGQVTPEDLVEHLAWHGIAAQALSVDPGALADGEALLRQAQKIGADLLVVGGYGHSRVRELVLGGVTRHLLAAAEIPVLMVH
jgi:nucleotide-binding universal stress UspA family protein